MPCGTRRSTPFRISPTQVIVYTEYPGQAPQVIEDQVTYPLTTALLAVPRSKVVRVDQATRCRFHQLLAEALARMRPFLVPKT